jgi:hypothetical protein
MLLYNAIIYLVERRLHSGDETGAFAGAYRTGMMKRGPNNNF